MARLNYQLDNANESGQEVISHLQETAQDPSPVETKVDGINSQWNELQGKLQELRNHVIDQVSQEKAFLVFFFFVMCTKSQVFQVSLTGSTFASGVPSSLCDGHAVCFKLSCASRLHGAYSWKCKQQDVVQVNCFII